MKTGIRDAMNAMRLIAAAPVSSDRNRGCWQPSAIPAKTPPEKQGRHGKGGDGEQRSVPVVIPAREGGSFQ
jgi:hypothetical protein